VEIAADHAVVLRRVLRTLILQLSPNAGCRVPGLVCLVPPGVAFKEPDFSGLVGCSLGHDGVVGGRRGRSGERAWRNLRVLDGRLWYRSPTQWWVRTSLRLDPDALVVVGRDHVEVGRLPWACGLAEPSDDTHWHEHAGWWLRGVPGGRANRAGIRINVRDDAAVAALGGRQQLWLPSTLRPPPVVELPALARYLATVPAARAGLGDPHRTRSLLARLAEGSWRTPRPPAEPLIGDKLDRFHAVDRVARQHQWLLIDRRPTGRDTLPPLDEATALVLAALPPWSSFRHDGEALRRRVQRHLQVGAWPFDALLAPPTA
jgi:hypothetical protein